MRSWARPRCCCRTAVRRSASPATTRTPHLLGRPIGRWPPARPCRPRCSRWASRRGAFPPDPSAGRRPASGPRPRTWGRRCAASCHAGVRAALAEGLVPVVAGFQGIGTHGELTTLGRGGTDLSAVVLAVALRADRCELFKDVGGVMEADPQLVPAARRWPRSTPCSWSCSPSRAPRWSTPWRCAARVAAGCRCWSARWMPTRRRPLVRAVRPRGAEVQGVLMLAVDRKERIARISVVGPAAMVPELLPLPAHGAGSFDEGGMRVVWAEVPLEQATRAAQAVHAAVMG